MKNSRRRHLENLKKEESISAEVVERIIEANLNYSETMSEFSDLGFPDSPNLVTPIVSKRLSFDSRLNDFIFDTQQSQVRQSRLSLKNSKISKT